tara:strand:- start:336 stop:716 length:381 start_codon:yes stop_codon:yes gene_type:complete
MKTPRDEYFLSYPTDDHGFRYVRNPMTGYPVKIPEAAATALVFASPYFHVERNVWPQKLKWFGADCEGDERYGVPPKTCDLENKCAFRLTKKFEGEEGEKYCEELWIYQHDGEFFLIVPPDSDGEK